MIIVYTNNNNMHFCSNCHNMYYLKIRDTDEGGNSLIYYCRNCGHEDTSLTSESICVSETQLRRSEQKFTHMVNEYTKYDPTLPRINTIKCPNQECSSNSKHSGNSGGAKKKTEIPVAVVTEDTGTAATATAATAATAAITKKKKLTLKVKPTVAQEQLEREKATEKAAMNRMLDEEEKEVKSKEKEHNEREVIYIRYDDINMKYVYLCVHCDTTWKTDNRV